MIFPSCGVAWKLVLVTDRRFCFRRAMGVSVFGGPILHRAGISLLVSIDCSIGCFCCLALRCVAFGPPPLPSTSFSGTGFVGYRAIQFNSIQCNTIHPPISSPIVSANPCTAATHSLTHSYHSNLQTIHGLPNTVRTVRYGTVRCALHFIPERRIHRSPRGSSVQQPRTNR